MPENPSFGLSQSGEDPGWVDASIEGIDHNIGKLTRTLGSLTIVSASLFEASQIEPTILGGQMWLIGSLMFGAGWGILSGSARKVLTKIDGSSD